MSVTVVDIMRHGEPEGGRRYRGQVDDPLSAEGWRQMRAAVGDHHPWQAVVTSPLVRCADFSVELAGRWVLPVETDPRFMERGYGTWEGKSHAELEAADPAGYARFRRDPAGHSPPGAEPLDFFVARVREAWEDLLTHHTGRHVLLVAHAGIVRLSLALALEFPLERLFAIQVDYASLTRLKVEEKAGRRHFTLVFHGGSLG